MNILVIFTGGTISSSTTDGYIGPDSANNYKLINDYNNMPSHVKNVSFDTISPYYILSENLSGNHINALANAITANTDLDNTAQKYDGIIITHGTDTLQYTAAALSLMLFDIKLPVVLVSSNFILTNPNANGLPNFAKAVQFISEYKKAGIFVAYKNEGEDAKILNGISILPQEIYSDKLYELPDHSGINEILNYTVDNISIKNLFENREKTHQLSDTSNILCVHPYPGQMYPALQADTKAILLTSYHSGTLCTEGSYLNAFLTEASQRKIPVFLVGKEASTNYESTKVYANYKINILPKLTNISAYVLLWLRYS